MTKSDIWVYDCFWGILALMLAASAHAAKPDKNRKQTPDCFSGMSVEDQHETGIAQLSAGQRDALSAWMVKRLGVACVQARGAGGENRSTPQPGTSKESQIEAEVRRRVAAELAAQQAADTGREQKRPRQALKARIAGSFKGWRGNTEFVLDNGQVWRQVGGETYFVRRMDNPEVELVPMALGSWGLRLKATGRTVKVRRIR